MSRALFVYHPSDYEQTKQRLTTRLDRVPTNNEILKETKTVVPPPPELRRRVMGVINYVSYLDLMSELKNQARDPFDRSPPAQTYFTPNKNLKQKVIEKQMKHVDKNCLSDPPGVTLHYTNPETGVTKTSRGTSSNENTNMMLETLIGRHCGVARADRIMTTFFEEDNDRKMIKRLGYKDYGTHRHESLFVINSMAATIGYSNEQLPFDITLPTLQRIGIHPDKQSFSSVLDDGRTVKRLDLC